MHRLDNITPSNEFPINVKLWYRRPIGERFDAVPESGIVQHIDGREINIVRLQYFRDRRGKATHWLLWISLHVQHDGIFRNVVLDHLVHRVIVTGHRLFDGTKIIVRVAVQISTDRLHVAVAGSVGYSWMSRWGQESTLVTHS